ncbi:MAG: lipid-A-disaccharide synthase [Bacteroidetes bacterium]|nr:lipid-A-disaccharide synthase [Bacteroidota bacterium]
MRYYIIAGEASGDLHASNLMRELKEQDPVAEFRCWGGDLMEQQGGVMVKRYRDLAFMGFIEVVAHLPTILRNFRFCKSDIRSFNPDAVILVDYPGFNLRIARFAHKAGLKVFYYISPQLWAWRSSRVKTIRQSVDKMFVILPFETEFYSKFNYKVDFVGHPLLDVINEDLSVLKQELFYTENKLDNRPLIALLPGSRRMEIEKMLKVMLSVRFWFPDYQFVVAGAPSLEDAFYQNLLGGTDIKYVKNQTYSLLSYSKAALVTSGTATLETALMNVPQVVCYKGSILSYLIARQLVKIKYISLVNLISGKMVVPELIQDDLTRKNLTRELSLILNHETVRQTMYTQYRKLKNLLGGRGASSRTATLIVQYLTGK